MNSEREIGIIVAMQEEATELSKMLLEKKTKTVKKSVFYEGFLKGKKVVLAVSGIGKVNAAYTVTNMSRSYDLRALISTGVAGGLGVLKKLDILVADAVVQHDFDLSAFGRQKGYIPNLEAKYLYADKTLVKSIKRDNGIVGGVIATGDQFIASNQIAKSIADEFNAVACDMESAAIGQVASLEGIPFVVVRVISDDASDDAESDFKELVQNAAKINANIVANILSNLK
jgi:adenosylhomocysteine nucleosidase